MIRAKIGDRVYRADGMPGKALRMMPEALEALKNALKEPENPDHGENGEKLVLWAEIYTGEPVNPCPDGQKTLLEAGEMLLKAADELAELAETAAGPEMSKTEAGKAGTGLKNTVFSFIWALMDSGWSLTEIDRTDINGLLKLMAWKTQHESGGQAYIDEIWPAGQ